ncbi:hypothetical protein RJ641_028706 [Dillenia turbinata]|uniref:3-beta hydroxysteroid dehydrogenase/isomerase domain-containing protein n=1 Tax=Dillenia turbinata TaxID=194707 RepID=A0AAN8VS26_9MAGN
MARVIGSFIFTLEMETQKLIKQNGFTIATRQLFSSLELQDDNKGSCLVEMEMVKVANTLHKLDITPENLKLFKAELLDYDSLFADMKGCDGVFHVASPVPPTSVPSTTGHIIRFMEAKKTLCGSGTLRFCRWNIITYRLSYLQNVELIQPAVNGTLNVLKALSSGAAISLNPSWPKAQVKDKTGTAFLKQKQKARLLNMQNRLDVVSVCPTLVLGSMLQAVINSSSFVLIKLLKECYTSLQNKPRIVNLKHFYWFMINPMLRDDTYVQLTSFTEAPDDENLSSEKLQRLGWSYKHFDVTLADSVEC